MIDIIDGDEDLGQLFHLLVLFSPIKVKLPEKETQMFKHFQQKITMMIYTHLMNR